jgi:hypothetical protein
MRVFTLGAAIAIGLCTALAPALALAQFGQAKGERGSQQALPKSASPLWATLRRTTISDDEKHGIYRASFPQDVKALSGQMVTLTGFMLPLDAIEKSHHFLLSKYTPVCSFCPPGAPNEVVEVISKPGVRRTDDLLKLTGRLTLINNGEKGLFFRLDQAG